MLRSLGSPRVQEGPDDGLPRWFLELNVAGERCEGVQQGISGYVLGWNQGQWKGPQFLMAKSRNSMAIFNSFLYVYQRVRDNFRRFCLKIHWRVFFCCTYSKWNNINHWCTLCKLIKPIFVDWIMAKAEISPTIFVDHSKSLLGGLEHDFLMGFHGVFNGI